MSDTMKAVVYKGHGTVELEDRPMPVIKDERDAIVKVTLSTICSSDLHIKHGTVPRAKENTVLGHEFVGEVIETGSGVKKFKKGDRVSVSVETFCGTCFFCRNGFVNNCVEGGWELGCRIDGCQAEYVRVPIADMGMTLIPDDVTDEAALFNGDILATGYWAASIGELKPADTVVVIGAGPTGICTLMSVKLYSPAKVIVVDVDEHRLELVKNQGLADIIVNSKNEDPLEVIMRETNGRGADRVFEVAGIKSTFELAWKAARPNAIVVVVALYAEPQEIPLQLMYGKNLIFKTGGVDGNSNYAEEIMKLVQCGKIDTSCLITNKAPLNDVIHGYEVFENRIDNCVKWVITPYER
ncbi:MAG: alcohol dehydrogenase [Candidatus Metalachnospira sp.]|nr:alcohol dehydrogenase [Candidatus Metalachnospira sp.]